MLSYIPQNTHTTIKCT